MATFLGAVRPVSLSRAPFSGRSHLLVSALLFSSFPTLPRLSESLQWPPSRFPLACAFQWLTLCFLNPPTENCGGYPPCDNTCTKRNPDDNCKCTLWAPRGSDCSTSYGNGKCDHGRCEGMFGFCVLGSVLDP